MDSLFSSSAAPPSRPTWMIREDGTESDSLSSASSPQGARRDDRRPLSDHHPKWTLSAPDYWRSTLQHQHLWLVLTALSEADKNSIIGGRLSTEGQFNPKLWKITEFFCQM